MHIFTANIAQILTERENITIANKVIFCLYIGTLTIDLGPF